MRRERRAALAAKRAVDVVVASALLLLFLPLMIVVGLLVLLVDGRPIFFRQLRPGLHGHPFRMWKFRTMRRPLPGEDVWRADDARTTRLGRFLRRTSLDELPELAHVITGKMSLVGPRPMLMEFLPRYSEYHQRRHLMRPGITGLAQVNGRSALTLGHRLDLDVKYVETWSLWLDLKILLRTLAVPFRSGHVEGQTLEEIDDVNLCVGEGPVV